MQIVNVATLYESDVDRAVADGVCYVGRPSVLGNPFVIGRDGNREQVVEKYRAWLWERLQHQDGLVLKTLRALTADSVLGCWCAPQGCHAAVIERAWRWLQAEDAKWAWQLTYRDLDKKKQELLFPTRQAAWDHILLDEKLCELKQRWIQTEVIRIAK